MLFESQLHDLKSMFPWQVTRKKKQAIRALVEQKRRIYPHEQAKADSEAVMARLEQLPLFKEAQTIMIYYPIHNEVDLRPLLQRYEGQKTFLLPVTHRRYIEPRQYLGEEMMQRGNYQIPEPQTSEYKGKIVAYDFQVKKHELPQSFSDHPLNGVITPSQSIGL